MTTPKMRPGHVEMVSVEWIMQNATGSVDGFEMYDDNGWEIPGVDYAEMIIDKGCDYDFGNLIGTILSKGFRVPIVLTTDSEGGLIHGNGHHRMVAAILLCLDQIPVYWPRDDEDYMCEHESETEDLDKVTEWSDFQNELWDLLH